MESNPAYADAEDDFDPCRGQSKESNLAKDDAEEGTWPDSKAVEDSRRCTVLPLLTPTTDYDPSRKTVEDSRRCMVLRMLMLAFAQPPSSRGISAHQKMVRNFRNADERFHRGSSVRSLTSVAILVQGPAAPTRSHGPPRSPRATRAPAAGGSAC